MLLRFDPFAPSAGFTATPRESEPRARSIPMDAIRHDDQVTVRFDLPGVDPASIDLEVERNVVTVRAERRWERSEGDQILAAERRHGRYERQLLLGDTLDANHLEASYADGVLTVTVPVAPTSKARKVAVSTTAAATPAAIDTTGAEAAETDPSPASAAA